MPVSNQIQTNFRRDATVRNESIAAAGKALKKYFPKGLASFDKSILDELYSEESKVQAEFLSVCAQIKSAKEAKDFKAVKEYNEKLMFVKVEKKKIHKRIKEAENLQSLYYRATKPYEDAQRVVAQAEFYAEVKSKYSIC